MFIPNLTNCDKEPIHIPGKIQSHGFLIALDQKYKVAYSSENISEYIPLTAAEILNKHVSVIESYLERGGGDEPFLVQLIKLGYSAKGFEPVNPYVLSIKGKIFNLIINKSATYYLLEFEPEISDLRADLQREVGRSLAEMLTDKSLSQLLNKTAEQIKGIIGYDRVMIYKFHEDGHGEVVAEAKNEGLDSLYGLHYPATDIPKQARELYKINLIRLIADVNAEPSAIATVADHNANPLDLTHSVLRAVSPIHIQYLKNMDVASSFSISLINQGELWGLVACHNYSPRFINYRERESAKLVGQVLSSALSFRQNEEDQQVSNKLKAAIDAITRNLLRSNDINEALCCSEVTIQDAVDSEGAALLFDNHVTLAGNTPDETFIKELAVWLEQNMEGDIYQTNQLPNVFPAAAEIKDTASGILVCRISRELNEYIIWFKPEVVATINWAGKPEKPTVFDENGMAHISPRTSFELWSQQVNNISTPWTPQDLRSAVQLRDEVNYAISRRANELRKLNEKLREAYDELDAFSYTISHDLKNPLTTIKSYSQLLNTKFELEPKAKYMVERILSGAQKMQEMIQEVLNYSKVGQAKIESRPIEMSKMLIDLKHDLLIASENENLTINIGETPPIQGDEIMVFQVFSNLMSNAVKYSKKSDNPVVNIKGEHTSTHVEYAISDNGIGIKPHEVHKIFDLFNRSDEVKDYEGSGVGLAIVKKIMEKHQGRIWLESNYGEGSTFFVSFQRFDTV